MVMMSKVEWTLKRDTQIVARSLAVDVEAGSSVVRAYHDRREGRKMRMTKESREREADRIEFEIIRGLRGVPTPVQEDLGLRKRRRGVKENPSTPSGRRGICEDSCLRRRLQ
jgi:hypothetical protein